MNTKILITGATGNVGKAVIHSLMASNYPAIIVAGVRDIEKSQLMFHEFSTLQFVHFDFENSETHCAAFVGIDILFLLRPPHISKVETVFNPLLTTAQKKGIRKIVFLSVQGADQMSFIPHAKIEKFIAKSNMLYCFLRPSYFMQNLTTTLKQDLETGCITLPTGNAVFNWVDIKNIGEVAAVVLSNFDLYSNQAIEITGSENLSFPQAVSIINRTCGTNLKFISPNLISFFKYKRKQGVQTPMILVMILLHFLPRFQKHPRISTNYSLITHNKPTTLAEFAQIHLNKNGSTSNNNK